MDTRIPERQCLSWIYELFRISIRNLGINGLFLTRYGENTKTFSALSKDKQKTYLSNVPFSPIQILHSIELVLELNDNLLPLHQVDSNKRWYSWLFRIVKPYTIKQCNPDLFLHLKRVLEWNNLNLSQYEICVHFHNKHYYYRQHSPSTYGSSSIRRICFSVCPDIICTFFSSKSWKNDQEFYWSINSSLTNFSTNFYCLLKVVRTITIYVVARMKFEIYFKISINLLKYIH